MPAFLDPTKPITTCTSASCEGCEIAGPLHCHFSARDLTHFLLTWLPPFFLGGAGIAHVGWLWLALWAITAVSFFGLLEIHALCSHCPHYAEPAPTLKCWANYGSPKLWKYRPGPMSQADRIEFMSGFAVLFGYPLVFLTIAGDWFLLAMFLLTVAGAVVNMKSSFCAHCFNFACPLNAVDKQTRQAFFARNPIIGEAWTDEI